jgi:hypothetical protein
MQFLMFCLFLFKLTFFFQNHVVMSPFRLLTNGSKQFCGLNLFGREKTLKKLASTRFRSLSLSLAGDGRCCVFGSMVCENQVAGRRADDIRRKVLERG